MTGYIIGVAQKALYKNSLYICLIVIRRVVWMGLYKSRCKLALYRNVVVVNYAVV